jgi:hypothetical protein
MLLSGVDLSMSTTVQQQPLGPRLLPLPSVQMSRSGSNEGASMNHREHHSDAAIDGPSNPDVLLALLSSNKKLEGMLECYSRIHDYNLILLSH